MQTVTAPDGATWRVKRHWISRRPKWRGREGLELVDFTDLFSFLDDTPIGPFLLLIFAVGATLFFTGLLAFFIEALIIVAILLLTLAAKFLFRRPWFVEAVREKDGYRRRWAVVGWKKSGQIVDRVALTLKAGTQFQSADARELPVPGAEAPSTTPKTDV